MDSFVSTVESRVVYLDGFDKLVSFMYIPRYYWFENKQRDESFLPPDILCPSFYRALQDFPIIAGRHKADKDGRGYVEIDRDNLNMPVYTDTNWDLDFKQIRDAGFSPRLLPETFDSARGFITTSRFGIKSAKLGIFHVRRLKNHSGIVIFASIAHGIVDGYGFSAFVHRWAEISKLMHTSPTQKVPERVFFHDRSIHSDYRQEGASSLDGTLLKLASFKSSAVTRFLSALAAGNHRYLIALFYKPVKTICATFCVPTYALHRFKHSVQAHAPQAIQYSTNDILTSLLAMTIGQAIQENNARKQNGWISKYMPFLFGRGENKPNDILLTIPMNLRPRINHPDDNNFVGNLMFARYVICPPTLMQAGSDPEHVSAVATKVREAISSTDKTYIGQLNRLINSEPDMFIRIGISQNRCGNKIVMTNISKFGHYELDFGGGTPYLIRPGLCVFPNYVAVMPCHHDISGYEVTVTLEPAVAQIVTQNARWMELVDSYQLDI